MSQIAVPSLQEQLDELTTRSALRGGGHPTEALARTVAHIARVAPGLAVGDRAPDFVLPDHLGRPVSLARRREDGPVVLTFYRGAWCPYCNLTLRAFDARLEEIRSLGAALLAVSPQAPVRSASLVDAHELRFEVLSDARQEVIDAYRLRYEVPAEFQAIVRHDAGLDLSRESADGSWRLPATGTFVIDGDGMIVAAGVSADPRRRMEPDAVVAALRAI